MRALYTMAAILFLAASVLFVMEGCSAQQIQKGADAAKFVFGSAAPLLPPPFGLIAGGVASLAGVVSSIAAGKAKGESISTNETPGAVATFFSDHHYLYPAIAGVLGFLQTAHIINFSQDDIAAIMSMIGLPPTLAQVYFSKKADAQAPAAPTPPTPAAPAPTT